MQTTETMDKLYLEISQFTQARTGREIGLGDDIKRLMAALDREETYLTSLVDSDEGPVMAGDIEGAFHRIRNFREEFNGGDTPPV